MAIRRIPLDKQKSMMLNLPLTVEQHELLKKASLRKQVAMAALCRPAVEMLIASLEMEAATA